MFYGLEVCKCASQRCNRLSQVINYVERKIPGEDDWTANRSSITVKSVRSIGSYRFNNSGLSSNSPGITVVPDDLFKDIISRQ